MSNLGTGYSYSIIISSLTDPPTEYSLPLCREGGLREDWVVQKVEQQTIDVSTLQTTIVQTIIGWRGVFTLDYSSDYGKQADVLRIKTLLDHALAGVTLTLIPRSDQRSRRFAVKYTSPSVAVANSKGGSKAFHKGLVLEFQTTNLVTSFPFINIDDTIKALEDNYAMI